MNYYEYIQSEQWKDFRQSIITERGPVCENCKTDCSLAQHYLHLHHLTYERLGHELPQDVYLLCAICHAAHHGQAPAIDGLEWLTRVWARNVFAVDKRIRPWEIEHERWLCGGKERIDDDD